MRFRARQNRPAVAARGVVRAAVAGIARRELIQEAVHFVVAHAKADRIGVWIESADSERVPGRGFAEFPGIVADRDGEATPPEWEKLSPEAPLPMVLLNAGKSAEQDLGGARDHIIFGALLELKRALWVPVESRGSLRGVLLAGSHKKRGALPLRLPEPVSAELALMLERDDHRGRAQQRQADITVTKRFLDELVSSGASDAALARHPSVQAAQFSSDGDRHKLSPVGQDTERKRSFQYGGTPARLTHQRRHPRASATSS